MNMIFLLVSFFMISMDITEGLLLRYNAPLINPNNKISLYGNGGGSIGGGGNYILHGGGNGGNDDDGDINFLISLIFLNIYKNNNLFDLIFYK